MSAQPISKLSVAAIFAGIFAILIAGAANAQCMPESDEPVNPACVVQAEIQEKQVTIDGKDTEWGDETLVGDILDPDDDLVVGKVYATCYTVETDCFLGVAVKMRESDPRVWVLSDPGTASVKLHNYPCTHPDQFVVFNGYDTPLRPDVLQAGLAASRSAE